jgi:16S rRNA (cytidine1402-2'-O)-methyltransferase
MEQGILYLLPSDFGEDSLILLPSYAIDIIQNLDTFIVENEKSARHFLKRIGYSKPLNSILLFSLNEHTSHDETAHYLDPLKRGVNIGILSEAGCPGVADPGSEIIKLAHQNSIQVKPLVGPSSILLALMASGFNGQHFIFHGYLPKEKTSRIKMIQRMESDVINKNQTQLFIVTPYHNNNLFKEIIETCSKNTKLCVATEVTLPTEFIKTLTIEKWKNAIPELHKRPTVFLIYK